MITAIPMNNQEIASHFTKALSLVFFDQQGKEVLRAANPALESNCAGKAAMLEVIQQHGASRVIVRHIGQKMLGRLLDGSVAVLQMKRGRNAMENLAAAPDEKFIALLDASQGSPSVNSEKKQANGGKCCEHQHGDEKGHAKQGRCCGRDAQHGNKAGHGQGGKCCH